MATILEAGTANYSTKVSDRVPKHRTPARWFKLTENTAYRQHRQVIRMVAASILLFTGNLSMADTPGSLSCAATDPLQAYHATRYRSVVLDGISIFYREAGNPNCPTLLLLHGFSSSSHMFRDLMPLLSRQFHLVAPDYPGFGYSDAPPQSAFTPDFSSLTDVMEKFVSQLKLKPFIAYMQDFGGPVGFRMATQHPEWFNGLIIQNANAYMQGLTVPQSRDGSADAPDSPKKTSDQVVNGAFIRHLYQHGVREVHNLNPDAWTVDIAVLKNPGAKRIQAALIDDYVSNISLYPKWQAYLKQHQPKTLVVWGRNDQAFSVAGAMAYKADIPEAEVILFDTGHFALEEDAYGIAKAISGHFATQ